MHNKSWKGTPSLRCIAYLSNHILHKSRVQLECPLIAVTLHAAHVIVDCGTSIGINWQIPRADVFWTIKHRGKTRTLISHICLRDTCVVWLGEEENIRVLAESNK